MDKTNKLTKECILFSMEEIKDCIQRTAIEDELLKLRIENAFLKELRRLRLEGEAKMKDLQES